ncbi:hypothetical protein GCM10018962_78460 [Dactylosporangium matsuzakiense]|uniref:Maltokinase N-terminal cap domain-containing protein n=2 Tax=Dactylosporangium matsuzakiense TaxID=53360 RepID=A0A9W6KGC2_9ACTN|nr:hypothetical protein GCM10017581_033330 [Dactylosporangium matsuzakiense]
MIGTIPGMALLHRATLVPGKLDLLAAWLPAQPWYTGPAEPSLERVGAFRFDDPDGAVGLETLLVRAVDGGPVYVTPLTYRDAPLDGAALVGTTEHSVLGPRWVYDAETDPVYRTALLTAILTGGTEAPEEITDEHGTRVPRTPLMSVRGTGAFAAGVLPVADTGLELVRVLDGSAASAGPALVSEFGVLARVHGV